MRDKRGWEGRNSCDIVGADATDVFCTNVLDCLHLGEQFLVVCVLLETS